MGKLVVIYDPSNGITLPDDKIAPYIDALIAAYKKTGVWFPISWGNELMIDLLRVAVKNGKIAHDEIQIMFNDEEIVMGPDGMLSHWPKGFCDKQMNAISALVDR